MAAVGKRGERALATDGIARRVCMNAARTAVARVAAVEEKREAVLSRRSLVAALADDVLYCMQAHRPPIAAHVAIAPIVALAVQPHDTHFLSVVYAEAGRALAARLASEALEAHTHWPLPASHTLFSAT